MTRRIITLVLYISILTLLFVNSSIAEDSPSTQDERITRLEQLVEDLTQRVEALESASISEELEVEPYTEPSEPVESIIQISKVKVSEKYSAISVEVTVKNSSKKQAVDAYTLIASAYDSYGEIVQYYGNDSLTMESADTIKPGKTSPKGYHWSLYNMGTTKKLQVAISKYHTTDGETVEIPEDQLVWVEGSR